MSLFYSKSTGGFYDDAIHTPAQIPSDAVAISQVEYNALMEGQSLGNTIGADANGNPILIPPVPATLAQVQASALTGLDAGAETLRSKFITANSGQVATYLLKQSQAQAYQVAGYTGTVPSLVQSEVAATGATAQAATDSILAQYAAWVGLAAAIETVRRSAKVAVSAVTDPVAGPAAIATLLANATTAYAAIAAEGAAEGGSSN
jgi:hypothetical protein